MKEQLFNALSIIHEHIAHPLKSFEDDEFAKEVFRAENQLDAAGLLDLDVQGALRLRLPAHLVELLVERQELTEKRESGDTAEKEALIISRRIFQLNLELAATAQNTNLSDEIRQDMGIWKPGVLE